MKIGLVGLGRTGKIVAEYLLHKAVLTMALCRPHSINANKDIGQILNRERTGILITSTEHLERQLFSNKPDVLIDFSCPQFLKEHLHTLETFGIHIVTAVTGYEPAEMQRIRNIAEKERIGVVMAPNITYGVNVLMLIAEIAASLLQDYDIEIFEEHHRHKKDRPSGTAKIIAGKIKGTMGTEREIPTHAVRAGGIVGKHKVLLCSEFDKIEIGHESISRLAFAEGAYKAAQFIHGKTGFFEMSDIFAYEMKKKPWDNPDNPDDYEGLKAVPD